MHFKLDAGRCDGFGFCAEAAPTLIRLDDDGQVIFLKSELGALDRTQAEAAVRACPVAALRLMEAGQ
jgi:ferredoxin